MAAGRSGRLPRIARLFGLKPSRGRVSYAPDAGEGWGGLAVTHAVSRSVRDSALLLDLTSGIEPGDPYAAPAPPRPFMDEVGRAPGRLKIAMMRHDHRGAALHPECVKGGRARRQPCAKAWATWSKKPHQILISRTSVPRIRFCSAANVARALDHEVARAQTRAAPATDVEALTWAVFNRGRDGYRIAIR